MKKLPIRPVFALAAIAAAVPVFAQQQPQPQEPPPVPPPEQTQAGRFGPLPEGLHLRAQAGVEHDSNVLRTSSNKISDTALTGGVGLSFNKRYGLQNVRAEVQYEQWWYQDQSSLDFHTLNYALAWDWSLTPRFHGVASADRREYREVTTSAVLGNVVGRRTERVELLEGVYDVTSNWRALAGISHTKNESSQPGSWDGEPEINWGHVGVGYDLPSGSSVRFRYREGDGEYHDPAFLAVAPFANSDFRDREYEVSGRWAATGKTTIDARLGHLSRDHGSQPQLDFSGWVGGANVNWEITGKTRMTAGYAHDLTATGSILGGSVESDRLFLAPVWAATGKTSFSLRYDYTRRRWQDLPTGAFDSGRRDTLQNLALGVDWAALRSLTVSGYVRQEKQSSSLPTADYSATVFGILAKATF